MATLKDFKKVFGKLIVIKGDNLMRGTVSLIREKEGQKGKYWTVALADGTKGLLVRDATLMESIKEESTYEFDVEKQGIFTQINDAKLVEMNYGEKKQLESHKKQDEYFKRKHPVEQAIIATEAYLKSAIEAYARVWASNMYEFKSLEDFDEQCQKSAERHLRWMADVITDFDPSGKEEK